jgi:hypothetical protein
MAAGAHRKEGGEGGHDAADDGDEQLDNEERLQKDLLVREHHLCICHGDLIKALYVDVAPLKRLRHSREPFESHVLMSWQCYKNVCTLGDKEDSGHEH